VRHLLSKTEIKWHIILADINEAGYQKISTSLDSSRTHFVPTDVANWDSQASLFKKAYEWSPTHRIDFFAANAGIADKEVLVGGQWSLDEEPQKPNLTCLDVDIVAVLYGVKLFIHYTRKARRDLEEQGKQEFHPKMVITASCVGQYPFAVAPQYCAAKHACIGLTRSIGVPMSKHEGIAVNCIMPAFVITNITPPPLVEMWPKEYVTPLGTVMRAYDELIDLEGNVEKDGKSNGKDGEMKTAQSVECVVEKLFYRTHVQPVDESQEFLVKEAEEGGLWQRGIMKAMEMGSVPGMK